MMERSKKSLAIFIFIVLVSAEEKAFSWQGRSVFPGREWLQSSPMAQRVDSIKMLQALDSLNSYLHQDGLSETLIVRNGHIIFRGEETKNVHSIWSCSKSITSIVLGLLIQSGKCGMNDLASSHEPLLKELYPKVTIKQMVSMTSGYGALGDDRWDDWESEDWSWTPYKPDKPYAKPGTTYRYWDENMMMLGRVLTQIAKEPLVDVMKRELTQNMDFGDWYWKTEKDIRGIPINNGCTDVHMNAEQLARIGHLYLNKGNWHGKQLLDSTYVSLSTQNQVAKELSLQTDVRKFDGRGKYGLGWWVIGDTNDMPNTPKTSYYMSGYNNNVCFVIPEWNIVFVRMGRDGNPEEGKRFVYDIFFKHLKKALID